MEKIEIKEETFRTGQKLYYVKDGDGVYYAIPNKLAEYIKYLENNAGIAVVSNQRELLLIDFLAWYSGMEEKKILSAYKRWLKERQ